jgi:N-methylhydantoinase A
VTVSVGVDVGGTFTKAVACDARDGKVAARAIVPTTHDSEEGVAEGVATAFDHLAAEIANRCLGPITLVAHSTTQAVNSLLEGDTACVGVLGIGRRPDVRRARKRTRVGDVRLAPGRSLRTLHAFLDASDPPSSEDLERAIGGLVAGGAESLCVSEAFGVDDHELERAALGIAERLGLPACAGHELSGLYGLEMRTVTAGLNAGILPRSLHTAEVVERAVRRCSAGAPVLVMRGDGGVCDLASIRRRPLITAFSGPAASVAGALHHLRLGDGIVVEVGGTSTNVSAVVGGRPVLSYVRVLEHVTCVRSLDVRVVGVAGGSLLRVARARGRRRLVDVGPRSAHIAGLDYCCFAEASELAGARPALVAPRPGDPQEYAVLETRGGRRLAPTPTCAANALGEVPDGAYAQAARADSAAAAFEVLGRELGADPMGLARQVLELGAAKVRRALGEIAGEQSLDRPTIVGLGGGAGALVPRIAAPLDLEYEIPPDAEVISSVGDALSPVRVEMEHSLDSSGGPALGALHRRAEEAAVAAGAAPATVRIESTSIPERRAVRVVAVGSVALESRRPTDPDLNGNAARAVATAALRDDASELLLDTGHYSVFVGGPPSRRRVAIVDGRGSLAHVSEGRVLSGTGQELESALEDVITAMARRFGPVAVAPAVRVVRGPRFIDLSLLSSLPRAVDAARAECVAAGEEPVVALLSRT